MGFSKFLGQVAKGTINNLLGGGPDNVGGSNPKALGKGVVQDWTHATKVFVGSDLLRAPKYKGMFHVSFVFNNEAIEGGAKSLLQAVPRDVLSVLTKSIELPKFTMEYSTLNSYNHTTYNYKKIKYEPITVTFHDDMADLVQTFWYFYYAYYFADGGKAYSRGGAAGASGGGFFQGLIKKGLDQLKNAVVGGIKKLFGKGGGSNNNNKEKPPAEQAKDAYEVFRQYANGVLHGDKGSKNIDNRHYTWGLNGSAYHLNGGKQGGGIPLLQAIEIYPLGNKKASMIVLHNPRIVAWNHDTFDYSAQGTATCQATIVYEGVTYSDQIDAKTVLDDVAMYDRHGAPGTKSKGGGIFSFIDKVDGILGKVQRGENLTAGDLITGLTATKSLFKKKGGGG